MRSQSNSVLGGQEPCLDAEQPRAHLIRRNMERGPRHYQMPEQMIKPGRQSTLFCNREFRRRLTCYRFSRAEMSTQLAEKRTLMTSAPSSPKAHERVATLVILDQPLGSQDPRDLPWSCLTSPTVSPAAGSCFLDSGEMLEQKAPLKTHSLTNTGWLSEQREWPHFLCFPLPLAAKGVSGRGEQTCGGAQLGREVRYVYMENGG